MNELLQVDFWQITLRTGFSFFVILSLTRIIGKRQIGQLTFFNYITGITIGSMAADIASASKTPFNVLISLLWWLFLTALVGYIGLKSKKAENLLDGQPTILIKEGKILKTSLQSVHLSINDLSMLLRQHQVFSAQDVHYAILEPNGKLSVLKKEQQQTVTKKDMNIPTLPISYFPSEIISEGKIVKKNLIELNLDETWVNDQLKKNKVYSIEEVFYAQIQTDGTLFINKY